MSRTMDPYAILGVARDADQDTIRKAYLKLAHKYHPDKTGGDKEAEDKLKEINAAYDILKNPEKRAKFDRFGTEGAGFGGFEGFGGGAQGQGFEAPFEDFFDMLFGQGGARRKGASGAQPGNDLELRLSITLEEAAFGATKQLRFNRAENCNDCGGTGAAPGSKPEPCGQCGGVGQVRVAHGFFSVSRTCPRCNGAGVVIAQPCRNCTGRGRIKTTRTIDVKVPAGVDTGSRIRVAGEGEPGRGPNAGRGDLYIFIQVEPHEIFQRDGTNLLIDLPVSFTQAALGASIRVPAIKGEAELKVPAGTQTGTQLRLRGLGMPDLRGYATGDQIVRIVVETPTKLSKQQKELLKKLEEATTEDSYPLHRRFMDSLRGRK